MKKNSNLLNSWLFILNAAQVFFLKPQPSWIQVLFAKLVGHHCKPQSKSFVGCSRRIPILIKVIVCFFIIACRVGQADSPCGDLANAFGPFDYRDPMVRKGASNPLYLVEHGHFSSTVEGLIGGMASVDPLDDIDYTLRAFPNHPRALHSISRYELQKINKARSEGKTYIPPRLRSRAWPSSAECYFDRAIRWQPSDPNVRLVYGIHLHLKGRLSEALQQYQFSEKLQPKSADLNYNMGLLYFELRKYDLAKQYAKRAYQLGYPLPGLRKKLAGVGQWP